MGCPVMDKIIIADCFGQCFEFTVNFEFELKKKHFVKEKYPLKKKYTTRSNSQFETFKSKIMYKYVPPPPPQKNKLDYNLEYSL